MMKQLFLVIGIVGLLSLAGCQTLGQLIDDPNTITDTGEVLTEVAPAVAVTNQPAGLIVLVAGAALAAAGKVLQANKKKRTG